MRYLKLICLFVQVHCYCAAQLPCAVQVTHYNETNGISNGRVVAMLQGQTGYLWFGTTNGLLSFDGYMFRQYNDPVIANTITKLAEDRNHVIWMSLLGGGLVSFDPAKNAFTSHKLQNDKDPSLAGAEVIRLFFDSKGRLWMGTSQRGLIRVDAKKDSLIAFNVINQQDTFYAPALRKIYNTVYDIYEDREGWFWLATHDGLYHFDPETGIMKAVREKPVQKNSRRFDLFRSIFPDNDILWLSAWAGGLSSYNRKTGEWKKWLPDAGRANNVLYNIVTTIKEKSDKEFWVCSPDKGLGVFDKTVHRFYFFNDEKKYPGLPAYQWHEIITDKDDNIWGLCNDGFLKIEIPPGRFTFNDLNLVSNSRHIYYVSDMLEDNKRRLISVGFANGLQVFNKQTGREYSCPVKILPKEEQSMDVRQILKDSHKNIWIVSRDFIYQYDTLKERLIEIPQPPRYTAEKLANNFSRAAEDKDGNIWFATKRNGLFVYNPVQKTYTHYNDKADAAHFINATFILDIAADIKGRMWLAGPTGFLGYTDPATKKVIQLFPGQEMGLKIPGTKTFSLFADSKGYIWVGTSNGLCYIDCNGTVPVLKKIFQAKDGLRSNLVTSIQEDDNNNIWCVTEAAVCMIRRGSWQVSAFDAIDGFTKGGLDIKLLNLPQKGMLFLTSNGYYSMNMPGSSEREKQAPLVLTKMMIDDKDFYYHDLLEKEKQIILSATQNTFSFEFAAIDFKRPDKQQYSYMLDGFDKDWIDAGDRRFVSYTNIPGGHYTFRVKSIGQKGYTKNADISIPLFIQTPFYKSIFFYLFISILTTAVLSLLYRNKMKHQQEVYALECKTQQLEKEKATVMYEGLRQQLNPHFLFNSLTSLSGLIQTNQKTAGHFLEQMSKIYRYILKNRESETVFLSDEINFVNWYVGLQKTRFGHGLQININVNRDKYCKKIAPVTLQNLTENAIKHNIIDADTPLIIDIFCEDEYLVVQNNLQRKAFVETSNKQGLASMQSLYRYFTSCAILITENENLFIVKIPLL